MRYSSIAGFLQDVVLQPMRPIILCLARHSTLAGRPGEHQMYNTLKREYCYPKMSIDVFDTVRHCQNCPQMGT